MKNILSAIVVTLLAVSSTSYAVDSAATDKPAVTSVKAAAPAKANVAQEPININTADAHTLTNLKGIGAKKAEAIIAWRKANGGFKTIEQFADVKGIGSATLEANRKNLRVQ